MRLIDADALLEKSWDADTRVGYVQVVDVGDIEEAPTIDPVKHGKWEIKLDEYDCEYMKCSCCGVEFYNGDNDTIDTPHNYCPNCGADMRGDQE